MTISKRHDPFTASKEYAVGGKYHGIYAHGVETECGARTLRISGQIGVSPDGILFKNFKGQCNQAMLNLKSVLKSADMDFENIVKMSFFLTRLKDMQELIEVRQKYLDGVRPAVTTLIVSELVSPDWFIEIEATACAM